MRIYSKESLIDTLRGIHAQGWIPNARPGNAGGIGNTLEDLLGITENNLPIPNASEWELKAHTQCPDCHGTGYVYSRVTAPKGLSAGRSG